MTELDIAGEKIRNLGRYTDVAFHDGLSFARRDRNLHSLLREVDTSD